MQPYFFPYIGYYQLVNAVDEFVFLDDVTFIKGGYINRNAILLNGVSHRITVAVEDVSSFRTIEQHVYKIPDDKFFNLLRHAYGKAPYYDEVINIVRASFDESHLAVSKVNQNSVSLVFKYLGINKLFSMSSNLPLDDGKNGERRVINICKALDGTRYLNSPGGKALYNPANFQEHGIELDFIEPIFEPYDQGNTVFVGGLSMIDVLMWNSKAKIVKLLGCYKINGTLAGD